MFWASFFVARHKQGISALQLQRDTGLGSYQTAWTLLHKVRRALAPSSAERLSGLVEVDESYVGARRQPGILGRAPGRRSIVAGAVEKRAHTAGSAQLRVLAGVSLDDIAPFLNDVLDPDRVRVRTDGHPAYGRLPDRGFRHERVVQGEPARAAKVLPWVHTLFGNLKTWLRGTFRGVSPKHLQCYLDEFAYRFNRRWTEDVLFGQVLRRAVRGIPVTYSALVAELPG